MKVRLKQLAAQTIVITGASSGIGLATARMAARKGARVVLAARSGDALRQLSDELNAAGYRSTFVAGDVGDEADVRRIADAAVERFGGFDTWINDAGISVYGRIEEVSVEDMRKVFETNFWGLVYGSRIAAAHLKRHGGALVNVGSTVSDRAIPLQGIYSASKHAVKGFTDALRMELEEEGAPVAVSLVKPGSIDTPFPKHAKNYMPNEPTLPPPIYSADVVAEAILHCATTGQRELFAGGGGKMISAMGQWAPGLTDRFMKATQFRQQQKDQPSRGREVNSLYQPRMDPDSGYLRESGGYEGHVMHTSFYTKATMHPLLTGAIVAGVGVATLAALTRKD